jgi:hypothetical protein
MAALNPRLETAWELLGKRHITAHLIISFLSCAASQSSSTFTMSPSSQSFVATPAAIAALLLHCGHEGRGTRGPGRAIGAGLRLGQSWRPPPSDRSETALGMEWDCPFLAASHPDGLIVLSRAFEPFNARLQPTSSVIRTGPASLRAAQRMARPRDGWFKPEPLFATTDSLSAGAVRGMAGDRPPAFDGMRRVGGVVRARPMY